MYFQTDAELVANIFWLVTNPEILIVGVAAIDSLKLAVIVTTFDPETKLSDSELINDKRVGLILSIIKVKLSVPL